MQGEREGGDVGGEGGRGCREGGDVGREGEKEGGDVRGGIECWGEGGDVGGGIECWGEGGREGGRGKVASLCSVCAAWLVPRLMLQSSLC